MTLLLADGFDAQTALVAGGWPLLSGAVASAGYVTGRSGSGSALQSAAVSTTPYCPSTGNFGASTTVILGFAVKIGASFYGAGITLLEWRSAGVAAGHIKMNCSNVSPAGQLNVYRGAPFGGTQIGAALPVAVPSTGWQYFEIKIISSTGTGGSIIIKQDGVQTFNQTGQNTGSANVDEFAFRWIDNTVGYGAQVALDDLYVCDGNGTVNNDFLGDVKILALLPNGVGTNTQLTPSAGSGWQCVDEVPPSTADYAASATTGQKDTYAYADAPAGYGVKAVQTHSYAGLTGGGTLKGRAVVKSGATTGTSADHPLSTNPILYRDTFETDPNTSAAWTLGNLNAAEFGWEVRP